MLLKSNWDPTNLELNFFLSKFESEFFGPKSTDDGKKITIFTILQIGAYT